MSLPPLPSPVGGLRLKLPRKTDGGGHELHLLVAWVPNGSFDPDHVGPGCLLRGCSIVAYRLCAISAVRQSFAPVGTFLYPEVIPSKYLVQPSAWELTKKEDSRGAWGCPKPTDDNHRQRAHHPNNVIFSTGYWGQNSLFGRDGFQYSGTYGHPHGCELGPQASGPGQVGATSAASGMRRRRPGQSIRTDTDLPAGTLGEDWLAWTCPPMNVHSDRGFGWQVFGNDWLWGG